MARQSEVAWTLALVVLLIPVAGMGLALKSWFPEIASLHGGGIQRMLQYTLVVTGLFFVSGHLALAYLIARAARSPRVSALPTARREWLVGLVAALFMAVVAEGGILVLGLPVWADYYGAAPADALAVEVTGRQFFWVVRYPGRDRQFGRTSPSLVDSDNPLGLDAKDPAAADDVVLLNEMHLPVDRPVRISLRSIDVIHSFFVPELRVKQDAMPGMTLSIWFVPTRTGEYEIACNRICGLGHYRMRGLLRVSEQRAFQEWLTQQGPDLGGS